MSIKFSSLSPIDGKFVWIGEQSQPETIDQAMEAASVAARQWGKKPLNERIDVVRNYAQQIRTDRTQIESLIVREVGKLPWEATAEVNAAIAKVEWTIQAQADRRSDRPLDRSGEDDRAPRRRIEYRPLGVSLVLGPFNFPLHLPGGQIIPALLAGNSVVFKPSEQATAVGQWMVDAWRTAGLPANLMQLIVGGPKVAARAIDSVHTSAVFLTGSRAAGRDIHRQLAGRPEVLLALELGGNNPIVIHGDVNPDIVASIVTGSAFVTAGQRCTCARRAIFVRSPSTETQIDRLVAATQSLRLGMPGDSPAPHLGPMISKAAVAGLLHTYEQLLTLGCQPLIPMKVDPRSPNLVRPTLVDGSGLSADARTRLGEMEWFGPLLVLQVTDDFDAAIESAANTPYGLAAALLGGNQSMFDRFVAAVPAGVVNWNGTTTGAAGALPFGGLGDSGNHRPAGYFAIDFCSDPIAILERSDPPHDDPWSAVK